MPAQRRAVHEAHGEESEQRMSASLEQTRIDVLKAAAAAVAAPAPRRGRSAPDHTGELVEFLLAYYRLVATEDLLARPARELATIAQEHRRFADERPVGTFNVRAFNPTPEDEGWSTTHTVVQIVVDDMPFLVDSVVAALGGFDRGVHLIAHPQMIASELRSATPPGTDPHQAREAARFLEWLAHNNFTFLGYREYSLSHEDGNDISRQVPGTGLGLLRYDRPRAGSGLVLTPAASRAARDSTILIITKANSRATVHRDVYLDYISVKR